MGDICHFCHEDAMTLNWATGSYSGIDIDIICGNILRARSFGNHDTLQDCVNIYFCPMCGKRLKEKNKRRNANEIT